MTPMVAERCRLLCPVNGSCKEIFDARDSDRILRHRLWSHLHRSHGSLTLTEAHRLVDITVRWRDSR